MTASTMVDANALETIREMVDGATVGKVFGPPITQDGITVLPVARVSGGGGGGSGTAEAQRPGGTEGGTRSGAHEAGGIGGGLGLTAKPLGVFVIRDGHVGWRPALDLNKVILGGQCVMITALLVIRAIGKARAARA